MFVYMLTRLHASCSSDPVPQEFADELAKLVKSCEGKKNYYATMRACILLCSVMVECRMLC